MKCYVCSELIEPKTVKGQMMGFTAGGNTRGGDLG